MGKTIRKLSPKGVIMLKPETLDTHFVGRKAVRRLIENEPPPGAVTGKWDGMMQRFNAVRDPLLVSLMKRSREREYCHEKQKLVIEFPDDLSFFKGLLERTIQELWKPVIEKQYGEIKRIEIVFGS